LAAIRPELRSSESQEIRSKDIWLFALKLAADLLATCPDSSIRNGAEAVTLAERPKQLSGGTNHDLLDTIFAAYAENRSFAHATEIEQQALVLATQQADTALVARLKAHLARYAVNEPLREAPATLPSNSYRCLNPVAQQRETSSRS